MIDFPLNPNVGDIWPANAAPGEKRWMFGRTLGGAGIWNLTSTPDAAAATAVNSASAAAASAAAAKNSRDQSLAQANVYATVAEGLAVTPTPPTYFDVPVDANYQDFIRYKNVNGGAFEVFRYQVATGIMNYWGISRDGKVQFRPDAVNPNATLCALFKIAPSFMYVDRFGQTPVVALGDLVGLVVPVNMQDGPPIITDPGFDTGTGWTFNAGWARTGGKAVATATNSTLRWITPLVALRRYWQDVEIVHSGGTLTVNLGSGTALTIPASGKYRIYPQCGGAPTGGLTFTGTGFTGSVDNCQFGEASPWIHGAQSDAERGTYELDPFTGAPRVNCPAGKRMKTESRHTMVVPTYMCLALGRDVSTTFTMAAFGAGVASMTFVDSTAKTMTIGTARSGVFANPSTRIGQFSVGVPMVVDCYLEAGTTSSWPNGGKRDVQAATGLSSGAKRALPNTFVAGDSYPNAYMGFNYTTGSAVNANAHIYGGFISLGVPISEAQRLKIIEYMRTECNLHKLDTIEYDGFLQIGQSNEQGAPGTDNPLVPPFATCAEYIDSGYLKPVRDPAQHSVPANVSINGSAGPAFAIAYFNATGRKPLMVGSAYSGEGLVVGVIPGGTWLGPKLVPWAAHKFKNAMRDFKVIPRAAILSVGEQDVTHAHTQEQYEDYLISLRDYVRRETGLAWLPILIKSLDDSTTNPTQYALIRAAQAYVCANEEGFYMAVPFQNYLYGGAGIDPPPPIGAGLVGGIHLNQAALDYSGTLLGNYAAALFTQ